MEETESEKMKEVGGEQFFAVKMCVYALNACLLTRQSVINSTCCVV